MTMWKGRVSTQWMRTHTDDMLVYAPHSHQYPPEKYEDKKTTTRTHKETQESMMSSIDFTGVSFPAAPFAPTLVHDAPRSFAVRLCLPRCSCVYLHVRRPRPHPGPASYPPSSPLSPARRPPQTFAFAFTSQTYRLPLPRCRGASNPTLQAHDLGAAHTRNLCDEDDRDVRCNSQPTATLHRGVYTEVVEVEVTSATPTIPASPLNPDLADKVHDS
ncbi:hypothetical protein C8R45DRAFT_935820 [Mycena sanguinolenta]|nr:hypothetical protein C8R45DRAFT_935820 [Mycena sanguinolenta]